MLRDFSVSGSSPALASPCLGDIPSPVSLVFTPALAQDVENESDWEKLEEDLGKVEKREEEKKRRNEQESSLICSNCDARMTPEHQCKAMDSEGNWEDSESEHDDLESEQILYPSLDLDSEDWAEKFTDSIRRFHGN